MEDLKLIIAKNIVMLRRRDGMTQIELAQKLNYSDKAVSKWERGESVPDIVVLKAVSDIFGVTVDYLVTVEHAEDVPPASATEKTKYNRKAIAYVSESAGWMVAIFAFIIATLILRKMAFQYLFFVYALPVVLTVRLVFNSVWFNRRHNYYIVSLLMWSLLAAVHITFLYFGINVALVYLLGVAGQIVIVLWSFINKPKSK